MGSIALPAPEVLTQEIHVWTMKGWKQLIRDHPGAIAHLRSLPIEVKAWMSLRLARAFTVYDERGRPLRLDQPRENLIYRFDWQEGPPPDNFEANGRVYPVPRGLDLYIQWDTPIGPCSGGLVSTLLESGLLDEQNYAVRADTYSVARPPLPPLPWLADVTETP